MYTHTVIICSTFLDSRQYRCQIFVAEDKYPTHGSDTADPCRTVYMFLASRILQQYKTRVGKYLHGFAEQTSRLNAFCSHSDKNFGNWVRRTCSRFKFFHVLYILTSALLDLKAVPSLKMKIYLLTTCRYQHLNVLLLCCYHCCLQRKILLVSVNFVSAII